MFLSVLISIYNAEEYIDECINSIMGQSEKDFELILVNDGSIDSTEKCCLEWVGRYPEKIFYTKIKNVGSLLARRKCMELSRGQFIYVMDADDYLIDSHAFLKIKEVIKKTKCDMIFFDEGKDGNKSNSAQINFKYDIYEGNKLNCIYKILVGTEQFNPLWNKVFSRDLIDWECDYLKYKKITNGTDVFQVVPIVFNAKKIVHLNEKMYFYRCGKRGRSISSSFNPSIYYSLQMNYLRLEKYAKKYCGNTADLKKILERRFIAAITTSLFKARLISTKKGMCIRYKYIKDIGESPFFRLNYKRTRFRRERKGALFARVVLIELLYFRFYRTLAFLMPLFKNL